MSGQIFISYSRNDSSASAGRLADRLSSHFPSNQIFMDVDSVDPGEDFVKTIEESVGSCDVLIAVIGINWLTSSDRAGKRRLEKTESHSLADTRSGLHPSDMNSPRLVLP